ncbi:MAG: hypothetical protein ACOWYE_17630 [Desulfatiglandales bacterium]
MTHEEIFKHLEEELDAAEAAFEAREITQSELDEVATRYFDYRRLFFSKLAGSLGLLNQGGHKP